MLTILSAVVLFSASALVSCTKENETPDDQTEISENVQNDETDNQTGAEAGEEQSEVSVSELDEVSELKVLSSIEDDKWIIVDTTYCKFRYPQAYSDVLTVEPANEGNSPRLRFVMQMPDSSAVCYTLIFNDPDSKDGIICGTLKTADGSDEMAVSVVFEELPAGLAEEWEATFYAVQETFNDVLGSMGEYGDFTAAE